MEKHLILLALFYKSLGVELKIGSKEDRLVLQKAMYLGQRFGYDLGYRFSWYLNGPYCSHLADDYFAFENARDRQAEVDQYALPDSVEVKLQAVAKVVCDASSHDQATWLEALASLDYAMHVMGLESPEATAFVLKAKTHLNAELLQAVESKLVELRKGIKSQAYAG